MPGARRRSGAAGAGGKQGPAGLIEGVPALRIRVRPQRGDGYAKMTGTAEAAGSGEPVQFAIERREVAVPECGRHALALSGQLLQQQLAQLPTLRGREAERRIGSRVVPGRYRLSTKQPNGGVAQGLRAERLAQQRTEAGGLQPGNILGLYVRAERDRGRQGVSALLQQARQLAGVAIRQPAVADQRVGLRSVQRLDGRGEGGGMPQLAEAIEGRQQEGCADRIVFHQQDAGHRFGCAHAMARMLGAGDDGRRAAVAMQAWRWRVLVLPCALLLAAEAFAATRLTIARLQAPGLQLEGVDAAVGYAAADDAPSLHLHIARASADGLTLQRLDWRCRWQASPQPRCVGELRVNGRAQGELALQRDAGMQLRWEHGPRSIEGSYVGEVGTLRARLRSLPLDWLQPLLATSRDGLTITGGTVGGEVLREAADRPLQARLQLADAGVDSAAGDIAAAGISAAVQLDLAPDAAGTITVAAEAAGGEVLFGPLYAALAAGSRLEFSLASARGQGEVIGPFSWRDPEGLSASFALTAEDRWNLVLRADDLARSSPRYLSAALAAAGLPDAELVGAISAEVDGAGAALQALSLQLRGLGLTQAAKGLRFVGADGSLEWRAAGAAPDSDLVWQQLAVYDVAMGPSRLALRSDEGRLHLRAPLVLAPLQGQLSINEGWIDPLAREAELSADVRGLSLAALSERVGWPPFTGSIAGQLPRARYGDQRLQVDGLLGIDVFGGRVELGGLALERPLGVAPTLVADVRLDDLDLTPLTAAFGFGEISGRLDGRIAGLRLVDWSPVAFDADLNTDADYRGPRRISQRAVQDIGRVGGGLAGGLQNQLLAVFDSFGYRRIGLRCRLENNVCQMGGVEDSGTGYVLIEGAGLPRVTVNGFQRRVDWPVLLARLQAATEGGIKID